MPVPTWYQGGRASSGWRARKSRRSRPWPKELPSGSDSTAARISPSIQLDQPVGAIAIDAGPDQQLDGGLVKAVCKRVVRRDRVFWIVSDAKLAHYLADAGDEDLHVKVVLGEDRARGRSFHQI